jgi:quercetin dioxygenase-like cupin family protein
LTTARIILAALSIVLSTGTAFALEGVTVTPLYEMTETASGKPITLPQNNVRVIVSTFDIAPGATLPIHKHPFARYGIVQAGTLKVVNVETNDSKAYKAGDFVVEMIGQWHRAEKIGESAVKLLVIDQVEGKAANTILKDQ